ncbi:MAG: hypothetical protein GWP08_11590 [Nitrospiraceae bacterium]|nr:hypothetical protein [Nitrospiraceae bacterium]
MAAVDRQKTRRGFSVPSYRTNVEKLVFRVLAGAVPLGIAAGFLVSLCWADGTPSEQDALRLHQLQVIGTHNSYHVRPKEPGFSQAKELSAFAATWDYTHDPLDVQLDHGVRSFELDVNNLPEGFEVYHWPIVDFETTCRRLVDCLQTVRAWSVEHPKHVPISFLLEIKDEPGALRASRAKPITMDDLDQLDAEILSVFPEEALITPDVVRGDAGTLEEAVLARNWPTLEESRGKVMFILQETNGIRDLYSTDRPSLEGRPMFVLSRPGYPFAAFILANAPNKDRIGKLVELGYIVRTRADTGLRTDRTRRDEAFASGAQIVSTDFPPGEAHPENGYVVQFPNGVAARPNSVTAKPVKESLEIEDPSYVQHLGEH